MVEQFGARSELITKGDCISTESALFTKLDAGIGTAADVRAAQEVCLSCDRYTRCLSELSNLALSFSDAGVKKTVIGAALLESSVATRKVRTIGPALRNGGELTLLHSTSLVEQPPLRPNETTQATKFNVILDNELLNYIKYRTVPPWFVEEFPVAEAGERMHLIRQLSRSDTRTIKFAQNRYAYAIKERLLERMSFDYKELAEHELNKAINVAVNVYSRLRLTTGNTKILHSNDADFPFLASVVDEYAREVMDVKKLSLPKPMLLVLHHSPLECAAIAENPRYSQYLSREAIKYAFISKEDTVTTLEKALIDELIHRQVVDASARERQLSPVMKEVMSKLKQPGDLEKLLSELDNIDALLFQPEALPMKLDFFEEIRELLQVRVKKGLESALRSSKPINPDTQREIAIYEYALRHISIQNNEQYSDDELLRGGRFAVGAVRARAEEDASAPSLSWADRIGVARAYLDNTKRFKDQGVQEPYKIAQYHDASIVTELFNKYAAQGITRGLVREACYRSGAYPENWLQQIIIKGGRILEDLQSEFPEMKPYQAYVLAMHPKHLVSFRQIVEELTESHGVARYFAPSLALQAAIMRSSSKHAGQLLRRYMFLEMVRQNNSRGERNQVDVVMHNNTTGGTQENEAATERVAELLSQLPEIEAKAVAFAFDLLPSTVEVRTELASQLGSDNLERYVNEYILPKLYSL